MNGFSLEGAALKAKGATMKLKGQIIIENLKNLQQKISELSNYYQGPASETIIEKFNNLSKHFEEFQQAVDNCGDHLITSANKMVTTIINSI